MAELINQLLKTPFNDVHDVLVQQLAAGERHLAIADTGKQLDSARAASKQAIRRMQIAEGLVKYLSSHTPQDRKSKQKRMGASTELHEAQRAVAQTAEHVDRLKIAQKVTQQWAGKVEVIPQLMPEAEQAVTASEHWHDVLSELQSRSDIDQLYAQSMIGISSRYQAYSREQKKQMHMISGSLEAMARIKAITDQKVLVQELSEDLRLVALTEAAKMSAMASIQQRYLAAVSRLAALQLMPDFLRQDVAAIVKRKEGWTRVRAQLMAQEEAICKDINNIEDAAVDCDIKRQEWQQKRDAVEEIQRAGPRVFSALQPETLRDHEHAVAKAK
eukprot:SAG25_NODE_2726_length_1420_cov_1.218774_1_plen_329_part_10